MGKRSYLWKMMALVLSICMLISSPIGAEKVQAAGNSTIYFLNSDGWNEVYAYVWGDEELLGGWPGTKAQNEGSGWYKISVPKEKGFNIIFNNAQGAQSGNAYIDNTNSVYVAMPGDAKYNSKAEAEQAMGYANANTRVYFYNSANWSKVSAYVYGKSEALGRWPGKETQSDGSGWYYVDVPVSASEGFTIIFNDSNNGNQADDIYINDANNVYLTVGTNAKFASKDALLSSQSGTGTGNGSTSSATPAEKLSLTTGLSGTGASLSYTEVEAEAAQTNGDILSKSTAYWNDIQSEASGRQAVKLDGSGEYVEFTLPKQANTMVIRYAMPDSGNGGGQNATISMYVNGNHNRDIALTSQYAWVYGEYPFNNNPANGKGHRFFDEVRLFFDQTYSAGTRIRLQKDSGDSAAYYIVDLADFEQVGGAIAKPNGYLSVTDYGAKANDNQDDYDAFVACINEAKKNGGGVYIPEGTYRLNNKRVIDVSGVTVRGAGMWYTTLYGAGAAFKVSGTCGFSDFAMTGVSTVRDDSGDLAAFEGYDATNDVVIQNIWMEHIKVGCWFYNAKGLVIQGCRIRNTYADGINLCSNVHNAVVQNNHLRNTGDDGIAIWPWQANSTDNTIQYNTVQCPTLANGIAVYGGGNQKILNNDIADNIAFGAGIDISTNFETRDGFTGAITVSNNILRRCGSYEHNYKYPMGSIWIHAAMRPITSGVTVSGNTVYDGSYSGVTFDGGQEINNVQFKNNTFYGTKEHAIHVRSGVYGSASLENHVVADIGGQWIQNDSSRFTVNGNITQGSGSSSGNSSGQGGVVKGNIGLKNEKGVIFYQDARYGGNAVALGEGKYDLKAMQNAGLKNDDISSVKVPFGYRVTLYADDAYRGNTKVLTADVDQLGADFNDVTSSIVIEKIQYRIVSRHSGMVMDVFGAGKENGANIIQWNSNGGDNQLWTVTMLEDSSFVIHSVLSGKVIDVEGRSSANGANIHIWDYVDQDNQQWWLTDLGDGYHSIISKHSNKSLDVEGRSANAGANILQWDYNAQDNQQWKFEAVK